MAQDKKDNTDEFLKLNKKTFMMYAASNYENQHCHDVEEFYQDLQIPMHLKKLFTRYATNKILKPRLIINHIICFFNVFDPYAACNILFYKMEPKYYSYLKTVLVYLNRCPEKIEINDEIIYLRNIDIDEVLLAGLEGL